MSSASSRVASDDHGPHLAELGVPLFESSPRDPRAPTHGEYVRLIRDLASSKTPRFSAALAPLFAAQDGERAADSVKEAVCGATPEAARRIGLAYRLARCLAISRGPRLRRIFGRDVRLPASDVEPVELPDPSEEYGEQGISVALELGRQAPQGSAAGDIVDLFDTWLDEVTLARRSREPS